MFFLFGRRVDSPVNIKVSGKHTVSSIGAEGVDGMFLPMSPHGPKTQHTFILNAARASLFRKKCEVYKKNMRCLS